MIYELHVGTFTPEGTFEATIARAADLEELGVTAIELMPIAEFPGERNWGYDGVLPWAAQHTYGGPEGLRRLVDAAHGEGIAVAARRRLRTTSGRRGATCAASARISPIATARPGATRSTTTASSDETRAFFIGARGRGWRSATSTASASTPSTGLRSPRALLAEIAAAVTAARPGALVIAESGLNDPS